MIKQFFIYIREQRLCFNISLILLAYIALYFANIYIDSIILDILQLLLGSFFLIFGSGFFSTLIIQWLFRKKFNQWEFLSFSLIGGLLILPLILFVEFFIINKINIWLPILNIVVLWIFSTLLLFFKKTSLPTFSNPLKKETLSHPLFVVSILGLLFTFIQVIVYPALPDLDPYAWLYKYTLQFSSFQLDYNERPLFGSLTFIGTNLLGLSIFDFFKYLFPFLFLIVIFPAWIIASSLNHIWKRWIFMLFTLTSPVLILYAQTPMPQAPLLWISFFFVFFLMHYDNNKDDFFTYSAGLIMFFAFFYHQAAIIIFAIWAVFTIIEKRSLIFSDKKTSLLLLFLFISNFSKIEPMYKFALSWTKAIGSALGKINNINIYYPAQYTNVDRNAMGWGSFSGVIKFYAFHMGPLLGFILLLFIAYLIFKSNFRSFIYKKFIRNYSFFILASSFILFFTIAEILPRFPNIALLPDRAWIFIGIFTFPILYLLLIFTKKIPSYIIILFIFCLIIGLSGAFYINYLKKYLITPTQWKSAAWIENNLPQNRLFISYGHKHLLPIHANTPLVRISSHLYCEKDLNNFNETLNEVTENTIKSTQLSKYYSPFLSETAQKISEAEILFSNEDIETEKKYSDAMSLLNSISTETSDLKELLLRRPSLNIIYPPSRLVSTSLFVSRENIYEFNQEKFNIFKESRPMYIYYAAEDIRNPYYSRPYSMTTWGMRPCQDNKFLFDNYPEKFKRIYSANKNEIIIWKIL